jgi:hypothetical protein
MGTSGRSPAGRSRRWSARHLGVLAPGASPALREEYGRRAAAAAAYREAAGITDTQQAVSPSSHRGNPELERMRQATIRALEIRDEADIIRGLTRDELEARILDAECAQACAPPDVSRQLRLTAQAEADSWQQAADAATRHDHAQITNAQALASQLAAERQKLDAASTRYEEWSAGTAFTREAAVKAKAELKRRGVSRQPAGQQPEPGRGQMSTSGRWQQFEVGLAAADRALDREYQAAIAAGYAWPPRPEPVLSASPAAVSQSGCLAARLNELLGQAANAAGRIAADYAGQETRAGYAARAERKARAEPEPIRQLEVPDQAEIEM